VRVRRILGAALWLACGLGLARADEPQVARTPEQGADAALAALAAGDARALADLAGGTSPDPWLVADELLARGESDAAEAFARAGRGKDVERLPAYVARRRGRPDDAGARRAAARAAAAVRDRDGKAALAALDGVVGEPGTVLALRLRSARATAQARLRQHAEALTANLATAEEAERLGWLAGAASALRRAYSNAYLLRDHASAFSAARERRRVEEARGSAVGMAEAVDAIADVHAASGEAARAAEWYRRARDAHVAAGNPEGEATAWAGLADLHRHRGEHAEACAAYERVIAIREALGDRAGTALPHLALGEVHRRRGEHEQALARYERALAAYERAGDRAGIAKTLAATGMLLETVGREAEALRAFERGIVEADAVGDVPNGALLYLRAVHRHLDLGNYPKAVQYADRALELYRAVPDAEGVALALRAAGVARWRTADFATADDRLQQALAAARALRDEVIVVEVLSDLGHLRAAFGDHLGALDFHARVLAGMEAQRDPQKIAEALVNLGIAQRSVGDYARAADTLERALASDGARAHRRVMGSVLANVGGLHGRLGDEEKALEYSERAFREFEAAGDRDAAARALHNVADASRNLGDLDRAAEALARAGPLFEACGDRVHAVLALSALGDLRRARGDVAGARRIHGEAREALVALGDRAAAANVLLELASDDEADGAHAEAAASFARAAEEADAVGDREDAVLALAGVARSHEALGDFERALEAARRGADALESLLSGLAEEQAASARGRWATLFEVGLRASVAKGDLASAASFAERGRAGALLESFGARTALRSLLLSPELVLAEGQARAKESMAARAHRASLDAGDPAAARAARRRLDDAREASAGVAERIQREAKRAASLLAPRAASLAEVQAALRADQTLVLYALTDGHAFALVVAPKEARVVRLPASSATIAGLCAAFAPTDPCTDPTRAVRALGGSVVDPLRLPEGAREILLSPEGPLGYVPFSVLLEGRSVTYVPSGTTLVWLRAEETPPGEGVLALGDPDTASRADARALAVVRGGAKLAPLPAAREEATAVGTDTLLGAEATEAALRKALPRRARWRAVHFACHGLLDPDRPAFSSLALSPAGEDDGFLTSLEVFRTPIAADLVVLSACETAKGRIYRAEGIVGLTRAFMFAGAPRVLCSLWKVDDEATRALMTRFYSAWNPKTGAPSGAAAALRAAQDHVRSQPRWAHPYYWAAWVLWGLPS
jgi:tetratricopeptide (TPR) repeat protein